MDVRQARSAQDKFVVISKSNMRRSKIFLIGIVTFIIALCKFYLDFYAFFVGASFKNNSPSQFKIKSDM